MAVSNIGNQKRKKMDFGIGLGNSVKSKSKQDVGARKRVTSLSESSFQDNLAQETNITSGEAVDILMSNGEFSEVVLAALQDKIHRAGDVLLSRPGYDAVVEYRNSVQTLIKSVLPYLHEKEELKARGKHNGVVKERTFTFINQINQKLDTIVKLVVNTQADQMRILKELDEIKGLIVNMLQ